MDAPFYLQDLIEQINSAHQTTFVAGNRYATGEQGAYALTDAQGQRYVLKWHPTIEHIEQISYAQAVTDRLRALIGPAALIGGIGAVGVLAAGVVGPWLLRVAFGPQYDAGSALLAWLTAAAVAIAMLTLTGAATVAASLHRAYSLGWVGATVASGLLLLLPMALQTRTVIALLCGPLVGIGVHLVALARAGRPTG